MTPVRRSLAARAIAAGVLACCFVLAGCSGSTDSGPPPTAAPSEAADSGTPLEEVDTAALVVPRAPFCDQVDPAAVTRALGEEPGDVSAYRSGQRIKISDDVADVVHEYGCRWTAGDGTAEAWVFAPPVTRRRAAVLAEHAADLPRCGDVSGEPDFGSPTSACRSGKGGAFTMRYQGLFGDAWLTCSLSLSGEPERTVGVRAGEWCAAVAAGAATSAG
jgi:hypothetical protein